MSLESKYKLYLPSIIGEKKETLDKIINEIDQHYYEKIENKIDSKTGLVKTYLDGTAKQRIIRPSKARLKLIQSKIKDRILSKIELPSIIYGGIKSKSNITNAKVHQGKKYVFVTDLKDFFPSISSKNVHQTFIRLGYNKQFAYYMTKLTTWKGQLPQGTPTSTHISNLFFLKTDFRLLEICKKNNITYTRYVDDLTFSSSSDFKHIIEDLLNVIKSSGIKISYRKTEYQGNQLITGIKVFPHKIDAPKNIILKAELELDNHPSCKPVTNYLNQIRKTNKNKY